MLIERLFTIMINRDSQSQEAVLALFLVDHLESLKDISLKEILLKTKTSKTTFWRFCKLLGVNGYTELQYQIMYEINLPNPLNLKINPKMESYMKEHKQTFFPKSRIFVFGEEILLQTLLIYKILFHHAGIELVYQNHHFNLLSKLDDYQFSSTDLIIYVSLFKTNGDLLADLFSNYIDLIKMTKSNESSFLYLGRVNHYSEHEVDILAINPEGGISDNLYQFSSFFETYLSLITVPKYETIKKIKSDIS